MFKYLSEQKQNRTRNSDYLDSAILLFHEFEKKDKKNKGSVNGR